MTRALSNMNVIVTSMKCRNPTSSCGEDDADLDCPHALDLQNNNTFDEQSDKEERIPIESCTSKLHITVQLKNNGQVSGDKDYIVIDEVENPVTKNLSRLLHPLILELYRHQPQVLYPLRFLQIVNSGSFEEVVETNSSQTCDLSRCNTDSSSNNKNEGFCCSCDSDKGDVPKDRLKRTISKDASWIDFTKKKVLQLKPIRCTKSGLKNPFPPNFFFELDKKLLNGSRPTYVAHNRSVECPRITDEADGSTPSNEDSRKYGKEKSNVLDVSGPSTTLPLAVEIINSTEDYEYSEYYDYDFVTVKPEGCSKKNKKKFNTEYPDYDSPFRQNREKRKGRIWSDTLRRRVDEKRIQRVLEIKKKRWNNGRKSRQTCGSDRGPSTLHCLKFSDLWYSVYAIDNPVVIQDIDVHIFEKHDLPERSHWVDRTRGNTVKVGTFYPQAFDNAGSISVSYSTSLDEKCPGDLCTIAAEDNYLLIPSHVDERTKSVYPEAEGGVSEYLVVARSDVSLDGSVCDKIGVSPKAFSEQINRCELEQGACLKNQPIDLWLQDMDSKINGKSGAYLVDNYGNIPSILTPSASFFTGEFLVLEAAGKFESRIEIELRTDNNPLLRNGSNLQIQTVMVGSLSTEETLIEISVLNTGFTASRYRPKLAECILDLPENCSTEGPLATIPPLQRHIFRIALAGSIPFASMTCAVEMVDESEQIVASRQIILQKDARCLCAFHCACSCLKNDGNVLSDCVHLMQEEYLLAGLDGVPSHRVFFRAELPIKFDGVYTFLLVLTFLLLLGKIKMLLGIRYTKLRSLGMDYLSGSVKLCQGLEDPVDSDLHWGYEAILNTFFFILYPIKMMYVWMVSCFNAVVSCCRKKEKFQENLPDNTSSSKFSSRESCRSMTYLH